jgi:hypothetical protein
MDTIWVSAAMSLVASAPSMHSLTTPAHVPPAQMELV